MTLRVIGHVSVLLLVLTTTLFLMTTLSLPSIVSAEAGDDGYISGYAAAVLEREFHLPAPSLRVQNGIITLHAADLKGVDRTAVIEALSRIRGAVRVAVIETATPVTVQAPAPAPQPSTVAPPHLRVLKELQTGFLPGGESLFKPLIADPRWPHFAMAYHYYLNDKQLRDVAAVSFGETFNLYRDKLPLGWWEVGFQAGVFAVFDLDAPFSSGGTGHLVNADYGFAVVGSYRYENFSTLARVFHQSSHLGDEFILRNLVQRVNLSYEGLDLRLSYDFLGDVFRLYGGGGYLVDRDPAKLKPGSVQWGAEFRSPWRTNFVRPIAAVDVQNREENDWHADVSARAGFELQGVLLNRNLQLLLEYFRGHSPNGQFYRRKIDYIGLGAHFHF